MTCNLFPSDLLQVHFAFPAVLTHTKAHWHRKSINILPSSCYSILPPPRSGLHHPVTKMCPICTFLVLFPLTSLIFGFITLQCQWLLIWCFVMDVRTLVLLVCGGLWIGRLFLDTVFRISNLFYFTFFVENCVLFVFLYCSFFIVFFFCLIFFCLLPLILLFSSFCLIPALTLTLSVLHPIHMSCLIAYGVWRSISDRCCLDVFVSLCTYSAYGFCCWGWCVAFVHHFHLRPGWGGKR